MRSVYQCHSYWHPNSFLSYIKLEIVLVFFGEPSNIEGIISKYSFYLCLKIDLV